ncbi:MAG: hypothetical protein AAGC45_06020 [Bacteroidota bacterium]
MKRIYATALVVLCGLVFFNCELDTGENFHFVSMEITEVDVPDFFVLSESHDIEVNFSRPDDCTFFQGFDVFSEENGRTTVVAIGSVLTDEDCSPSEETLTGTLTLIAEDVDFYTLRFYTGEDASGNLQYLEYQVPVMEGINQ